MVGLPATGPNREINRPSTGFAIKSIIHSNVGFLRLDSKGAGEGKVPAHLGGHGGGSEIYNAGAHPLSLGNSPTGGRVRGLCRWWAVRGPRPRPAPPSPIGVVLEDRGR